MSQTILLIEDDPLSARLADLLLKSEGYQVVIAQNGLEGLNIARNNPPDLILLDLMLPGMDGFEVLNQLRADPQTADVRVAVVSSKAQPTDKETAAKIGADDYVTKPYRKAQLLEMVRSLISEQPERASKRGVCVLLVGSRGGEAAPVTVQVGLALVNDGEDVTLVDMRPFSVEHSALLGLSPPSTQVPLANSKTMGELTELAAQHPDGLRLLNNLAGSGAAGQLTPQDANAVLNALSTDGGFVLADLPLYPADILSPAADRCARILLVVQGGPTSLAAARSALTLMERAAVEMDRVGIVLVGQADEGTVAELGQEVVGAIPAEAGPDDPALQALADRLLRLRRAPT